MLNNVPKTLQCSWPDISLREHTVRRTMPDQQYFAAISLSPNHLHKISPGQYLFLHLSSLVSSTDKASNTVLLAHNNYPGFRNAGLSRFFRLSSCSISSLNQTFKINYKFQRNLDWLYRFRCVCSRDSRSYKTCVLLSINRIKSTP